MKVLMLVMNTFEDDSRVSRTARTLVEQGVEVTLLCVHREGLPRHEKVSGFNVIRAELSSARQTFERAYLFNSRATKNVIGASGPQLQHQVNESNTLEGLIQADQGVAAKLSCDSKVGIIGEIDPTLKQGFALNGSDSESDDLNRAPLFVSPKDLETVRDIIQRLRPRYPVTYFTMSAVHSVFWLGLVSSRRTLRFFKQGLLNGVRTVSQLFSHRFRELSGSPGRLGRRSRHGSQSLDGLIDGLDPAFEKRKIRYSLFAARALEIAQHISPDIVHAHDFNCLIAAEQIRKELNIPFVYDSHELWVERNRPNIIASYQEKQWEKEKEQEAIKNATFSITVCDSIADHLAKAYNVPRPVVIRNTPYRRAVERNPEKNLRVALGLDRSNFLLVYLGRCAVNRGLSDILMAMPETDPRVRFVTLGAFDPKYRPVFDEMVRDLGIGDRVFCHDPVVSDDVPTWIIDCDLSLTTMNRSCLSYLYTLPNKLFESIQAGLPVIGPDSPEIIRIIDQYQCGTIYRDRDHLHLAACINSLASDPQRLGQYRSGSERAAQELCWENEEKKLIDAYSRYFNEKSAQPGVLINGLSWDSEVSSGKNAA